MQSTRLSKVVSISLSPKSYQKLEGLMVSESVKSRSALIERLIDRYGDELNWQNVYRLGEQTAQEYGITSEEDVLKVIDDEWDKYKTGWQLYRKRYCKICPLSKYKQRNSRSQ